MGYTPSSGSAPPGSAGCPAECSEAVGPARRCPAPPASEGWTSRRTLSIRHPTHTASRRRAERRAGPCRASGSLRRSRAVVVDQVPEGSAVDLHPLAVPLAFVDLVIQRRETDG